MAKPYFRPVPDSVCKEMLLGLLASVEAFQQDVAPRGLLHCEYISFFRPHLLLEYKWYRIRRIQSLRKNKDHQYDTNKLIPERLQTYLETNTVPNFDEKIELTLILAHVVLEIFDHPHMVFDLDGWAYRLQDPATARDKAEDFLLRTLIEYRLVPDNLQTIHSYCPSNKSIALNCQEADMLDYDFYPCYRFVFRYLKDLGYDWQFRSSMHIIIDDLYNEMQNNEGAPNGEDHSRYDPNKAVLQAMDTPADDEEEDDDWDSPEELSEDEIFEIMYAQEVMKQAISAYRDVYGKLPDGCLRG